MEVSVGRTLKSVVSGKSPLRHSHLILLPFHLFIGINCIYFLFTHGSHNHGAYLTILYILYESKTPHSCNPSVSTKTLSLYCVLNVILPNKNDTLFMLHWSHYVTVIWWNTMIKGNLKKREFNTLKISGESPQGRDGVWWLQELECGLLHF